MKYPDYTLLTLKSLDGSITADEKTTLDKWLHSDLQNQKVHDEILMIWNGAWEDDYTALDEEHFLDQRERLMHMLNNEVKKEGEINQSFFRRFYQNVAAAAVIVVTVTVFTSFFINKNYPHHIVRFKNASFKKVTEVLQMNYNVRFQISESTSPSFSFTGTFVDEDVHTVVESISEATGFKFELKNGIYFIKSPS